MHNPNEIQGSGAHHSPCLSLMPLPVQQHSPSGAGTAAGPATPSLPVSPHNSGGITFATPGVPEYDVLQYDQYAQTLSCVGHEESSQFADPFHVQTSLHAACMPAAETSSHLTVPLVQPTGDVQYLPQPASNSQFAWGQSSHEQHACGNAASAVFHAVGSPPFAEHVPNAQFGLSQVDTSHVEMHAAPLPLQPCSSMIAEQLPQPQLAHGHPAIGHAFPVHSVDIMQPASWVMDANALPVAEPFAHQVEHIGMPQPAPNSQFAWGQPSHDQHAYGTAAPAVFNAGGPPPFAEQHVPNTQFGLSQVDTSHVEMHAAPLPVPVHSMHDAKFIEPDLPLPFAQPGVPLTVHSYFVDNAVACLPAEGVPVSETSTSPSQQPAVQQEPCDPMPVVATGSLPLKAASSNPSTAPKTVSVLKPFVEENLPTRPALVKFDDIVLVANVEKNSRMVEWEWSRAVAAMGLKTSRDSVFFTKNKDQHLAEMMAAEIGQAQITYRGWGSEDRGQHGLGSSAFVLLMLLVSLTKQVAQASKANAIKLVVGLIKVSVAALGTLESCPGMVYGRDARYHDTSLQVDASGVVQNLNGLLQQHPCFTWAWAHLMAKGFCGCKITSAVTHPTLWDLVILLVWAKNNPATKKVWAYLGQFLWPKVLFLVGSICDKYVLEITAAFGKCTSLEK